MPIWSLTAERLEKLMDAIARKKAEHDELLALTEKDLWCRDLDDFCEEWERQDQLDREIQADVRRMGRRASKKIGAGRSKKAKDEDAWEPEKKKGKAKAAPAKKVETKSAQRFAEMFDGGAKPAVKKEVKSEVMDLDDFSDDDFAALSKSKPAAAKVATKPPASRSMSTMSQSEEPEPAKNKRAAASKAKALFDLDSESDLDNDLLGDVGNMVKGIGKDSGESSGRLSLHAMSRPESSHGQSSSGGLPKPKSKASRFLDDDSMDDESNYEKLAKSSPNKTAVRADDIDEFLSDDEPMAAPSKPAAKPAAKTKAASKPASSVAGLETVKKARGRPAASKAKTATEAAKAKPAAAKGQTTLSPAAKAYALKKAVKKSVVEDDSDEEMAAPSPSPKPAARGRPGRAAAAKRAPVIDVDSSMNVDEDDSDDPFDMDDDDD